MKRDAKTEPLLPIDHSAVIDGFGQLVNHVNYLPFETFCGLCDAPCHVTSRTQKHILETNRVPVKMLQRGAIYCERCRVRRTRINELRKADNYTRVVGGKEELDELIAEEKRMQSKNRYLDGEWPY